MNPSPLLNPAPPAEMGASPGAPVGASPSPGPASFPDQMLSTAQAKYDAVSKEVKKISRIRGGLDRLVEKGDAVTSDDVLDEMASLVAHGADPKMFAAMMAGNTQEGVAPMPPQGEPLARWLQSVESDMLAPYEAQLRPAAALAQHQLGVAAMHKMIEAHASQGPVLPAPNTPAPSLLQ